MSRSGYSEDGDNWAMICWRGAVSSAAKGKRGQLFFKELLTALDDMSVKRLITDELESAGEFCTLGVLGKSRGLDMKNIEVTCPEQVSGKFDIACALAQEVVYMNDEYDHWRIEKENPEQRWVRMRKWVESQIASD